MTNIPDNDLRALAKRVGLDDARTVALLVSDPSPSPQGEPVVDETMARSEALALAERAGIDLLDDHDEFIADMTSILVAFAKTAVQSALVARPVSVTEEEIERLKADLAETNRQFGQTLETCTAAVAEVERLREENSRLANRIAAKP